MRKLILLVSLALVLAMITGCSSKEGGNKTPSPSPAESSASPETASPSPEAQLGSINDYFPKKEDVCYTYEGKGNEYAPYKLYIDFSKDNKVQQRKLTGGTVMVNVVEIGEEKATRVFSSGEIYYRENFLDKKGDNEETLLMEPLEVGTSWVLKDLSTRTITNISADVTTPLGKFKAIEVTTQSNKDKTIDYYTKDIGLVKSVFISGNSEISSTLAKIEEKVPFIQSINFYYPSGTDEKIYYMSKKVSFKTNDETKQVLEIAYKETIGENFGKIFKENTKINSLIIDDKGIVNIDLNKAFVSEMIAGAPFEAKILQCLTNTFGQYYNSEKVLLTIDGQPYESGHIKLEKEQFFSVKLEGTVEIK